jgi:predicted nuclease of predicted toxin-antitoxin system
VPPRFLINENLSPQLAGHLRYYLGFDAVHANELSLRGAPNADVLARAIAENRVVMTSNGQDFRKLGRMSPEHPGLAVLLRASGRQEQIKLGVLLATAIEAEIRQGTPPDGRLFEIGADGIIRDHPLP